MNIQKIKETKTKIIGKQIQYQEEITSTHIIAKQIANNKQNNGKIILAEMQTEGIGTKGKKWYTGKGNNIAMSIILHPTCTINKLEGLTKIIAIDMQQAIKNLYQIQLEIKEPNDLLLNGKKICGILTEISTISEKVNYLIISVGFNVNEDVFSKDIEQIATSLEKEYGKLFEREEIIKEFIELLEKSIEKEIGLN